MYVVITVPAATQTILVMMMLMIINSRATTSILLECNQHREMRQRGEMDDDKEELKERRVSYKMLNR